MLCMCVKEESPDCDQGSKSPCILQLLRNVLDAQSLHLFQSGPQVWVHLPGSGLSFLLCTGSGPGVLTVCVCE